MSNLLARIADYTDPILVPVGGSGKQASLSLRVWEFADGAELRWLPGPDPAPVCWHPNNKTFTQGQPCDHIRIWEQSHV